MFVSSPEEGSQGRLVRQDLCIRIYGKVGYQNILVKLDSDLTFKDFRFLIEYKESSDVTIYIVPQNRELFINH